MLYEFFYFVTLPFSIIQFIVAPPLELVFDFLQSIFGFIVSLLSGIATIAIFLIGGLLNSEKSESCNKKHKEVMAMGKAVDDNDPTCRPL